MASLRTAPLVLAASTVAFAACFAVWVMYGVLITYLVAHGAYDFSPLQVGVLVGTPILSGAVLGLIGGMLAEQFGGRKLFAQVMMIAAIVCFATSMADGFIGFFLCGIGFGLAGASFAVGIEYVSHWYPQSRQGTALGIFGAGMIGAAVTTVAGPVLLEALVSGSGFDLGWRLFPRVYGAVLLVALLGFWVATPEDPTRFGKPRRVTASEQLRALGDLRVWRFGLYYFALFGGFLSLAQMLPRYLLEVYQLDLATAGVVTALFIIPCALARAVGGWLSDRVGARAMMYAVLGGCVLVAALLTFPPMVVETPGGGIVAERSGHVRDIRPDAVVVGSTTYAVTDEPATAVDLDDLGVLPLARYHHEVVVGVGDSVVRDQLLARGVTQVFFRAHIAVFCGLVIALGLLMGLGCAAVYKHIPDYFPERVGTVGGLVSVAGGVGGFSGPIVFGWLVANTGVWTAGWVPLVGLCLVSLVWMHVVIVRLQRGRLGERRRDFEQPTPVAQQRRDEALTGA